jgi:type II secretory pathway pseudopilin PulG
MKLETSDPTGRPGAARTGSAGFTLIEATISIGLLAITIGALGSGVVFGLKRATNSQEELRATQIITEKFETLRLYTWDQLKWSADYDDAEEDLFDPFDSEDPHVPEDEPDPFVTLSTFTVPFKPGATNTTDLVYQGTFNATFLDLNDAPTYSNAVIKVDVSVSWLRDGKTQTRSASTLFSRYGLQNNIPH